MKGIRKFNKVLGEFKHHELFSSSGTLVTTRNQALAIAYAEARSVNPRFKR